MGYAGPARPPTGGVWRDTKPNQQIQGTRGVTGAGGLRSFGNGPVMMGSSKQQGGGLFGMGGPVSSHGGINPGGGGGGTTGSGSGPVNYSAQGQANPAYTELINMYKGLFNQVQGEMGKPLDFAAERANTRMSQSQQMREAQQNAAAGGRGGMWGSQIGGMQDSANRTIANAEAGYTNRESDRRMSLLDKLGNTLGGLSGGIGGMTNDMAQQMKNQLAAQQLNLESWWKQQQLPLEYFKAQTSGLSSVLSGLGSLKGLL